MVIIEKFDGRGGEIGTPRLGNNPQVKKANDANEKYKNGVSPTTQVFCKMKEDGVRGNNAVVNHTKTNYKANGTRQRKRIEFTPDEDQAMSEFTPYNPFFYGLTLINFILQLIGEFLSIFKWLVRETFNFTYDMLVPKDMSGKLGIKGGTKYCVNKLYWRYFLTMLCPPAGVFMAYGISGWVQIIICCILSILYYVPGFVYALIVMNRSDVAEQIEIATFGSCEGATGKDDGFFISNVDNEAKCNRVAGDKCHPGGGQPVPNDPMAKSCCMQPEYNTEDGRWYRGDDIALNAKGEEIQDYKDGELMCKPVKLLMYPEKNPSGVCVFKSTGRPGK